MSNRSGSGFAGVNPSSNDNTQSRDGCNSDSHGIASGNDSSRRESARSVSDVRIVKHPSELMGTFAAHGDADARFDVFRFSAHGIVAILRIALRLFRASMAMFFWGISLGFAKPGKDSPTFWKQITPLITQRRPENIDFRKRPIRRLGSSDCSLLCSVQ